MKPLPDMFASVTYIRDRLPNAKARKELQTQLDDNEHQILRALECM